MDRIEIIKADITRLEVDAIVNAANTTLLGGGGVDGAIHRVAGPRLMTECMTLLGCKTGEAKITQGYNLRAKHVIHTVGPVWRGGTRKEPELLARCYRNSLALAVKHDIKTMAFPSISTGAYRYPPEQACRIALAETLAFLAANALPEKVTFACFSDRDLKEYQQVFAELTTDARPQPATAPESAPATPPEPAPATAQATAPDPALER